MALKPESVLRPVDAAVVREARTLLRTARFGALAFLDPTTGAPGVSRVGVATDCDGAPILFLSALAGHSRALQADPRCALLLGEPGKGDALAHPRLSLQGTVVPVPPDDEAHERISERYLRHLPKSRLYEELPDFSFLRLELSGAFLNGGFGKASMLAPSELLLTEQPFALAIQEATIIRALTLDHTDLLQRCVQAVTRSTGRGWMVSGVDPAGLNLSGPYAARLWFNRLVFDAEAIPAAMAEFA